MKESRKMRYKAVVFDLYGTLVENFSRQVYDRVQKRMAKILDVPYPKFWQVMGETFYNRVSGSNRSPEEEMLEVCRRLGVKADNAQIAKCLGLRYEFTRNSVIPETEVLEALSMLKRNGFHIGLVTNCNRDVPLLFPDSPLASYIDAPIFSCVEGVNKPDHRIYEIVCEHLKIQPQESIYVGDGSSEELTGAAAIGMLPILKWPDLTDVYDRHRPELENWQGITINDIAELPNLLSELT